MKKVTIKPAVRYSQAFKIQLVREVESGGQNFDQLRRKYGIAGTATIQRWLGKYGNGSIGKIIRVEKPKEINELEQLRTRVRTLERLMADTNIDLALERAYTQMACKRAGIEDVAEFKKKAVGMLATKP
jgi:transposase